MTCRDVEQLIIPYAAGREIPPAAKEHIAGCDRCGALLAAMRASGPTDQPSTDVLQQIQARVREQLKPVRPPAPASAWVFGFLLVASLAVTAGVAEMGTAGWHALGALRRMAVFPVLGLGLGLLSILLSRQSVPGSRLLVAPRVAVIAILGILAFLFAAVFEFHPEATFVATGLTCLSIGLECALPVAVGCWLILRRGMVLNPAAAGALTGLLAGLSGLTLLEIFCPNPNKYHILAWHLGVALASTLGGTAVGWIADRFGSSRRGQIVTAR